MSLDRLRSDAKKSLLEGKYKKALELFQEIHRLDPQDLRSHVKLAELKEKTGDTAGAITDYIVIANDYAEQGFVVQAIAINKIILRLDPKRTEIKERLKELSKERGDDWAVSTINSTTAQMATPKLQMERTPLLSELSGEEFESFMDSLQLRHLSQGESIFGPGDSGEHLYLVAMGHVRLEAVSADGSRKAYSLLHDGDFFGEHGFMAKAGRKDAAVAETECDVLTIDRATFDQWVEKYPSIQSTVEDFYRRRVLARVLSITPVFEGVPADARAALADRFTLKEFSAGETIVRENEKGSTFYLIRSGTVSVHMLNMEGTGTLSLGSMAEGAFFGEVSLLTDKPRTATVTAETDVELMELTREDFNAIVASHPSVLKVVEAYQKKRVQQTIKTLMNRSA